MEYSQYSQNHQNSFHTSALRGRSRGKDSRDARRPSCLGENYCFAQDCAIPAVERRPWLRLSLGPSTFPPSSKDLVPDNGIGVDIAGSSLTFFGIKLFAIHPRGAREPRWQFRKRPDERTNS